MDCQEWRIDIETLEIALKMWGSGPQRVIALHGWLDNAGSFDALIPQLTEELQIAAVDLPGHGRSQWRGRADAYYFADWAGVVLEIADALEWEQFSLLGHSMGGAIASITAPLAPERVDRMVFLDALGPMTEAPDNVVERLRRALTEEQHLVQRAVGGYGSTEEMAEALQRHRGDVSKRQLQLLIRRTAQRRDDGRWWFSHDPKLQASSRVRFTEPQVMAFLDRIACPVRLIRPHRGWPVDEATARRRIEAIPDIDIVKVKGGHHVHLESPELVCGPVAEFLASSGG